MRAQHDPGYLSTRLAIERSELIFTCSLTSQKSTDFNAVALLDFIMNGTCQGRHVCYRNITHLT